jgi:hypothetical protein
MRIVAREAHRCFLRIREYLREPYLNSGFPLPRPGFSDCSLDLDHAESRFRHACNSDMQFLRQENRWAGNLDLRMAAEAYRMGTEWALRNSRTKS